MRSWIPIALVFASFVATAKPICGDELPWRVGTATSEMLADDAMVIGGGIGPGFVHGQEGKLQATATFIQGNPSLCIVAIDVLMMHRDSMVVDQCVKMLNEFR